MIAAPRGSSEAGDWRSQRSRCRELLFLRLEGARSGSPVAPAASSALDAAGAELDGVEHERCPLARDPRRWTEMLVMGHRENPARIPDLREHGGYSHSRDDSRGSRRSPRALLPRRRRCGSRLRGPKGLRLQCRSVALDAHGTKKHPARSSCDPIHRTGTRQGERSHRRVFSGPGEESPAAGPPFSHSSSDLAAGSLRTQR